VNERSDNLGSTPVGDEQHRRELQEQFGQRYERIQTAVHGYANRRQRRRARFHPNDERRS
jgi:hypothetical protein